VDALASLPHHVPLSGRFLRGLRRGLLVVRAVGAARWVAGPKAKATRPVPPMAKPRAQLVPLQPRSGHRVAGSGPGVGGSPSVAAAGGRSDLAVDRAVTGRGLGWPAAGVRASVTGWAGGPPIRSGRPWAPRSVVLVGSGAVSSVAPAPLAVPPPLGNPAKSESRPGRNHRG
jgi:hypothetical protein